ERQAFHLGLETLWQVVSAGDRYFNDQAPWALRKTDATRMGTVLYVVADVLRRLAILAQPFMPGSCGRLLDQLAVPAEHRSFADLERMLPPGVTLPKPAGVFPRFVEAAE
ncbi:MAG: methionine--tRNA ligase, partial [Gemmatimonadales bacterium]